MPRQDSATARDPITGLCGREWFVAQVDAAIAQASREDLDTLWVGITAMPRLPFINAGFGHEAGDDLIRGVADIIRTELPEAFATARLEGAELVAASFGPARRISVRDQESEIRFLGVTIETAGTRLFTNVRAGIAGYAPGDNGATLLRKARLALAKARMNESSDREVYSDELGELAQERIHVARNLLDAIEANALALHYQPKIDLHSGRMIGVEALVRWPTADGGSISPGTFVPAAEASGLVVPLGDWVLEEGCRQAARWQAAGFEPFHVAVNVSAMQFQKTDIVGRVRSLLETTGLGPEWLELEVTEGALMAEADEICDRLAAIRDLGVELAIDDFGTGYSSLSYLKRFPVHRLKIDQSFVRFSHQNREDRSIVRSVIAIGKNLGLKVLAEGIESASHVELLAEEGCGEGQGYYYSRPLEADALTSFAHGRT